MMQASVEIAVSNDMRVTAVIDKPNGVRADIDLTTGDRNAVGKFLTCAKVVIIA
jgi:hypothetical protein